jgi:hypothetical protein
MAWWRLRAEQKVRYYRQFQEKHPAQGKTVDSCRRCGNQFQVSPHRQQTQSGFRPFGAGHSAAALPPVAGLTSTPGLGSSFAQTPAARFE